MMTQELLDIMDALVVGGLEAGRWWFFCDVNNQAAVFGTFEEQSLSRLTGFGDLLVLPTNRRNTRQIADETAMLTRPRVRSTATVEGVPVRYSWYKAPSQQPSALIRIIKQLLAEQVRPSQVTVLSPRSACKCCAASVVDPEMVQVTSDNAQQMATGALKSVSYCSISSFKGLENDFIVVTDIEELEAEWWRSVIYVGMSRARVGLHLLVRESSRSGYEECLRRWLTEQSEASLTNTSKGKTHDT